MRLLLIIYLLFISCYQVSFVDSKDEVDMYKRNFKVKKVVETQKDDQIFYETIYKYKQGVNYGYLCKYK